MTILATDAFDGTDADLGTAWDVMTSEDAWLRLSGVAQPTNLLNDATESNNSVTWPDDQYSVAPATVDATTAGAGPGVAVRCATGSRTYYRVVINGDGEWELAKLVTGTFTSLASGTTTYSAGAIIRLESQSTTLRAYYNGSQLGTDVTDSAIATGRAGVSYSSPAVSASLASWEGGDLGTGASGVVGTRSTGRGFERGVWR